MTMSANNFIKSKWLNRRGRKKFDKSRMAPSRINDEHKSRQLCGIGGTTEYQRENGAYHHQTLSISSECERVQKVDEEMLELRKNIQPWHWIKLIKSFVCVCLQSLVGTLVYADQKLSSTLHGEHDVEEVGRSTCTKEWGRNKATSSTDTSLSG